MADNDVVIRISAKNLTKAEFEKARIEISGIGDEAAKSQPKFASLGNELKVLTGILTSVVAAVGLATVPMIKASLEAQRFSDELDNLQKRTELSFGFLQILGVAAERSGIGLEVAAKSVNFLQNSIYQGAPKATAALNTLGLSLDDLRNKTPEQQFELVASALGEIENPTMKAGVAVDLFGQRGGAAAMAIAKEMEIARARVEELGLALSDKAVAASDQLGDSFGDLSAVTNGLWLQFGGAINQSVILQDIVPRLSAVVGDLSRSIVDNTETIQEWVDFGIRYAIDAMSILVSATGVTILAYTSLSTVMDKIILGFMLMGKSEQEAADLTNAFNLQTGEMQRKAFEALNQLDALKKGLDNYEPAAREAVRASKDYTAVLADFAVAAGEATKEQNRFRDSLKIPSDMDLIFNAPTQVLPIGGDFIRDIEVMNRQFEVSTESTVQWSDSLAEAGMLLGDVGNALSIFGIDADNVIGKGTRFISVIDSMSESLGKLLGSSEDSAFGLGELGKSLADFFTSPMGIVAGIGAGMAALLFAFAGGRDPNTVMEEAGRDMGVALSDALAKQIHESGQNIQLFLPEIFAEGKMDVDRFAQEVGDIFSLLEQGALSTDEAIGALEETIPILIEQFQELGPEGQAQVERIINAARTMGIEFEGLQELIAATFAPSTVEELMEAFELTREQVLALEEETGVSIQNNLQRMAAEAGLTAKEFRELRDAAAEHGIDMEEIDDLAQALGISIAELAEKWGLDIGGAGEETSKVFSENAFYLEQSAQWASLLADELGRARVNAGGIEIPNIPAGGGDGFQFGTHGLDFQSFGARTPVVLHGREAVIPRGGGHELAGEIAAALGSSGAGGTNISVMITQPLGSPEQIRDAVAVAVKDALENNTRNIQDAIYRRK